MYKTYICIFLLLLVIILLPKYSKAANSSTSWHINSRFPFKIFSATDSRQAIHIMDLLSEVYIKISSDLDFSFHDTVSVYLCDSEKRYQLLTAHSLPEWSSGVASPAQKLIILKAFAAHRPLQHTSVHELTHIILHAIVKDAYIPRWFDEGLSVYYSNDKTLASLSLVSKALATNSIIPLSEIDDVLSFNRTRAQLAYQESYLTIVYIIDKYGIKGLRKLVQTLASSEQLEEAMLKTFNIDLWQFEKQWYIYIQHHHRWNFLSDIDEYLWLLILALFLLGFLVIRLRNHQTIKKWEQEGEDELW